MLKLSGADEPMGQKKAGELRARQPKVSRHTRAWVDDKELCLEVECSLSDGAVILVEMNYCWASCGPAPWLESPYYFMVVVGWLLNNQWLEFYRWVQEQFDLTLERQATDDYFAEYDEPCPLVQRPEAEPCAAADRPRDGGHTKNTNPPA
jgi:hypothetical protein